MDRPRSLHIDELIRTFLEYLQVERGHADNTIKNYGYDLDKYEEFVEKTRKGKIDEVTRDDLVRYLTQREEEKLSSRSISRWLVVVKEFHRFCLREGLLGFDPTLKLRYREIRKLRHVATRKEIEILLNQPDMTTSQGIRDAVMLEMMYSAGLRVSELINLKHKSLLWDTGFVRVLGKGSKERLVPLGEVAIDKLHEYLDTIPEPHSDFLFLTRLGKPFLRQACWKMVKHYVRQSGLKKKITPHTFRHSFATHLLSGGANLMAIREMLGHVDVSTTQEYLHVDIERLKRIHKKYHPRG